MNSIRSLLMDPESNGSLSNLDKDDDIDNYEDCRIELRSHNLVNKFLYCMF